MTFRHLEPILAREFTCHFVDLPGAGASEWGEQTPFGLKEHAATLGEVVEALGLERLGLLGHDSGGAIARILAADLGDRVFGMVLSGTEIPHHHPLLLSLFVMTAKLPGSVSMFRSLLRSRAYRRSIFGLGGSFSDLSHLDGDFHEHLVAPLQDRRTMEGQLRLARKFDSSVVDKLEEVHRQIRAPVLLLWGQQDPYFPADKAEAMAAQFAGPATFEAFEDARLLVHEEHPRRFAERSQSFLRACLTGQRSAVSA